VLHTLFEDKQAVMKARAGGFVVPHKVFNGHMPSLLGKHLPRVPLSDKSVRNLA